MKNIILPTMIVLFLITLSCSKEDDNNGTKSYALYANDFELNIKDNKGQDLLDSLTVNHYSFKNIKLYYLNNGNKEEVYDSNMDLPRNINLSTESKPYVLGIGLSYHLDSIIEEKKDYKIGRSVTYLELNELTTDTIVSEWKSSANSFTVQKIWYNDSEEAYDVRNSSEPYKVIKNVN